MDPSDLRCHQESLPQGNCPSLVSILELLEGIPALLWHTDPDLRFTWITGAALQSLHADAAGLLGRQITELFSSDGRPRAAWWAHQRALQGNPASFEIDVKGRELRGQVRAIPGSGGAVAGAAGIALDMTDRIVAERALRFSEHSYRSLVEGAPYAICRSTIGGALLQVNRAMSQMLGYDPASPAELLLNDLPLIFHPPGSFDEFQRALLEDGAHPTWDGAWLRRDGGPIDVRVSGRVVRDPSGNVSHFDIFAEDVTEKKRLEAQLSQAQRMQAVGQLAGGIAHDFNNLLTVISGHVELMVSEASGLESHERLLEVRHAVEKAATLTRQLLAFSRRQVLHSRTINLNEVVESLMGILRRLIREDVDLAFRPQQDLGSVNADPNEMERVLVNLTVNAQEAMPSGGRLIIETANVKLESGELPQSEGLKPGDYVQISVRDTGVGMDRETQARIFEPFFTTRQLSGGTGLGLAVVYGVVRQSGGAIRVESAPGAGSTFHIYLPRVPGFPAPAPEPAGKGSLPRGAETILFAEDDPGIRSFVTTLLQGLGYKVLASEDGAAAIRLARKHDGSIDLLLTDLIMPVMSGRELAAVMKSNTPDLKIVFISGYTGQAGIEKELELAGVAFLQKPFSIDALAHTIRAVLDTPAA